MEEENRKPSKKVMVAIDDNECSYYALMWVLNNLNDSIKGWLLVVLAAQPPANCSYVVSAALGFARMHCPVSASMHLIKSVQEQKRKLLLGLLEKAKTVCESRGVCVGLNASLTQILHVLKLATGSSFGYTMAVCSAITKYNVNLIVVSEKFDRTRKRAFLGSISHYCTQNANHPVLVVRKSI